jgi:hypothetical protein
MNPESLRSALTEHHPPNATASRYLKICDICVPFCAEWPRFLAKLLFTTTIGTFYSPYIFSCIPTLSSQLSRSKAKPMIIISPPERSSFPVPCKAIVYTMYLDL